MQRAISNLAAISLMGIVLIVVVFGAYFVSTLTTTTSSTTTSVTQSHPTTRTGNTTTTFTNQNQTVTTDLEGCVAQPNIDEGKVISEVLNSSEVTRYTNGAFAFNWAYIPPTESCTSVSLEPVLVEVNVTGFQTVSGNWSSQYSVTYANNTLLTATVSQSYKILNVTVAKLPDLTENVSFTSQQKEVIAFVLSNSTVRALTTVAKYYVGYMSPLIGSENQTYANDYYVVLEQVNGNLAVGVYVNSNITQVVGVFQLQFCRLNGWNGNYCDPI